MKKRISCIVLAALMLLSTLSGCKSTKSIDDDSPITKGEFFAYFVYLNQMTSDKYTNEQILACKDGSVEAEVLYEWGYVSEKMASTNLDKEVDRETVVTVVANSMFDLKTGDTKSIKDSDMLENPQLIADAYASGLFELENGYFNGAKKMSFNEVSEVINRATSYAANFHYDTDDYKCEFSEDVATFDEDNDYEIIFDDTLCTPSESYGTEDDNSPKFTFLADVEEGGKSSRPDNYGEIEVVKAFSAAINQLDFITMKMEKGKQSSFAVQDPDVRRGLLPRTYLCGVLESYQVMDNGEFLCHFTVPSFDDSINNINKPTQGASLANAVLDNLDPLESLEGWEIKFSLDNGAFEVKATNDSFYAEIEDTYSAQWRNARKSIKAEASFKISDFHIDVNNLKSFKTKKGKGYIKVTCDTETKINFSQNLRYTPDNNRHGGFPSNISRARLTDAGSKGARTIKIARLFVGNGIINASVYVYMSITADGKIEFSTDFQGCGFEIDCNNGNLSTKKLAPAKESYEKSMELNVIAKVGVDTTLNLCGFIPVFHYDLGVYGELDTIMDLYYESEGKTEEINNVFASSQNIMANRAEDSKFGFCVDVSIRFYVKGELLGCAVKVIVDKVVKSNILDFEAPIGKTIHFHNDNGTWVDKCQRGKTEADEDLETSDDGSITLSTYKVILSPYTCDRVLIEEIPFETKKRINSSNSITVSSSNEGIVKATYYKNGGFIILTAVDIGSAEITITAKTGALWWKENVTQKISVTVSPNAQSGTVVARNTDFAKPNILLAF